VKARNHPYLLGLFFFEFWLFVEAGSSLGEKVTDERGRLGIWGGSHAELSLHFKRTSRAQDKSEMAREKSLK